MTPLDQSSASHYLATHNPEIKEEIENLSQHQNFAGVLQAIVNYMRLKLAQSDIKVISRRIKFVNWVYLRGDSYTKSIIENLFIRSFNGLKKRCTPQQWCLLYIKLPHPFKIIYATQKTR